MRSPYFATLLACSCTALAAPAFAETQSLTASVGGTKFESDDPGITYLMPTKTVLNLIAKTKGASAYPPPKTPIDRLSIVCKNFQGKAVRFEAKDFGGHGCEAVFVKGESPKPFGEPQAEYRMVPGGKNWIEITGVKGKVIDGKFALEAADTKTKATIVITEGVFRAEDRQL